MDIKKDEALCKKYPNLYKDRSKSPQETCMCWGFSCGDGWYDLIDKLSAKLEKEIIKFKEENPEEEEYPAAAQVKEKFSMLRFYMTYYTKEMDELIKEAETKSSTICEDCGQPGEYRPGGWVRTLCDNCNTK